LASSFRVSVSEGIFSLVLLFALFEFEVVRQISWGGVKANKKAGLLSVSSEAFSTYFSIELAIS
jgi:hypothetical protein